MNKTPLSEQIQIVLCGIRNSGKSSLMNNLFEKDVSIISDQPGTTTDPVTRSMELGKLGPVAFHDTAGFDDEGMLGQLRIQRTHRKTDIANIIILVTKGNIPLQDSEKDFLQKVKTNGQNLVLAVTFVDQELHPEKKCLLNEYKGILIDNINKIGIKELKTSLIDLSDKVE